MADYIYLLDHRLSAGQRAALRAVREVARTKHLTVFLVGGAVRDLTSGSPVRDLDVVVLGNALKLKKDLEKAGAVVDGEYEAGQAVFVRFPGNVRMEVGSTLSVTYPKPGKPVMKAATILDDLRRRDFTANAMALSLNEGSYGLLMDPLNGVADIENRELRLVSNYGFIEDPVRMIRAARLMARLGWTLDEKTQTRYETGKQEGYIAAMQDFHRGYETEEIVHEEDPVRVLKRLESEGWMKHLAPFWTTAKVNTADLERLRETQTQLQMQAIHPDTAAANFPLLTAKLSPKEIATLKSMFPRQGFVAEIDGLENEAREVAAQLSGKGAALPSQAWRMMTSARPEALLQVAFSTKSTALQAKFKSFYTDWPQARQKMPYLVMQEMRIVPELAGYDELLEKLFFELMDGKLTTPEEMKAFLEPYSPPAPPPPVNMRRLRAAKKEAKPAKSRSKKAVKAGEDEAAGMESVGIADGVASAPGAESSEPESDAVAAGPAKAGSKAAEKKKTGKAAAVAAPVFGKKADTPFVQHASPIAAVKAAPLKAVKAAPAGKDAKVVAVKAAAAKEAAVKEAAVKGVPTKTAKAVPQAQKAAAPAKKAVPQAQKAAVPAKKGAVPAKKSAAAKKGAAPASKAAGPAKKSASPAKKVAATRAVAKQVLKKAVKLVAKKAAPAKAPLKAVKTAAKKLDSAKKGKTAPVKSAKRR